MKAKELIEKLKNIGPELMAYRIPEWLIDALILLALIVYSALIGIPIMIITFLCLLSLFLLPPLMVILILLQLNHYLA